MKKLFLICLFAFFSYLASAQLSKYQALYLFNFTRYIEWPMDYQQGNFLIAVIGSGSEISAELKDIASKRKVANQTLEILEFKGAKDVRKCHILFVPKEKMGDFDAISAKALNFNTLIVTEDSSFPASSAINLVFDGSKLKYDVNLPNAKAAGLKVSDKLIAVSK